MLKALIVGALVFVCTNTALVGEQQGVDSNLRAVLSHLDGGVWLRPKADGIQDFTYTNYNDWEVLRVGICENLIKEAPQPRVACPTKTW